MFPKLPSLRTTVRVFARGRPRSGESQRVYDILTNSQSKELGWTPAADNHGAASHGRTLNQTIAYLNSLDYVGLFEVTNMCFNI
jgi:hypothetical protein